MTGVWVLAAAVVLFDVLAARQIVVEYRRYRYRRIVQKMATASNDFAAVIGEAFVPAMRNVTAAMSEFTAELLAAELREELKR